MPAPPPPLLRATSTNDYTLGRRLESSRNKNSASFRKPTPPILRAGNESNRSSPFRETIAFPENSLRTQTEFTTSVPRDRKNSSAPFLGVTTKSFHREGETRSPMRPTTTWDRPTDNGGPGPGTYPIA